MSTPRCRQSRMREPPRPPVERNDPYEYQNNNQEPGEVLDNKVDRSVFNRKDHKLNQVLNLVERKGHERHNECDQPQAHVEERGCRVYSVPVELVWLRVSLCGRVVLCVVVFL